MVFRKSFYGLATANNWVRSPRSLSVRFVTLDSLYGKLWIILSIKYFKVFKTLSHLVHQCFCASALIYFSCAYFVAANLNMKFDQETALSQLREAVFDLKQDDETLLRFLKVNGFNPKKTEEKLRKSVKWFKDNNAATCLTETYLQVVIDDYKLEQIGHDKDGHPVFYMPIGQWQVKKMIELGYTEESFRYRVFLFETVMAAVKRSQKSKFVVIMDMVGLTYKKCAHYETMYYLGQTFRDFEENYPERLRACYIINAPWAFSYVYNAFKHCFSSRTINKAKIFDTNVTKWRKALLEKIPEKCIDSCQSLNNPELEILS